MSDWSFIVPGPPPSINATSLAHFWEKVQRTEGCWLWTGYIENNGYANFTYFPGRVRVGVHRLSYELTFGPIPIGLQIDHLCRVRHCLNPDHLQAVTSRENLMRGTGVAAINAHKTHCKRGHEFTPENTAPNGRSNQGRACKECRRIGDRRRRKESHA